VQEKRSNVLNMPTLVESIMTRKVLTVAGSARLADVSWGLALKRVQGAPVKDDRGRLIGVLSRSDIGAMERAAPESATMRASEAMTPVLYAILQSATVKEAAARFVETGCHQLVVFDDEGGVVGLVTATDLLKLLLADGVDL
jgi:CBS domain-containing protein